MFLYHSIAYCSSKWLQTHSRVSRDRHSWPKGGFPGRLSRDLSSNSLLLAARDEFEFGRIQLAQYSLEDAEFFK
jgi:hypothetical protein